MGDRQSSQSNQQRRPRAVPEEDRAAGWRAGLYGSVEFDPSVGAFREQKVHHCDWGESN